MRVARAATRCVRFRAPRCVSCCVAFRGAASSDYTEDESYKRSEQWLVANGQEMLERLNIPEGLQQEFVRRGHAAPVACHRVLSCLPLCLTIVCAIGGGRRTQRERKNPMYKLPPRELLTAVLYREQALVKKGLRADLKAKYVCSCWCLACGAASSLLVLMLPPPLSQTCARRPAASDELDGAFAAVQVPQERQIVPCAGGVVLKEYVRCAGRKHKHTDIDGGTDTHALPRRGRNAAHHRF